MRFLFVRLENNVALFRIIEIISKLWAFDTSNLNKKRSQLTIIYKQFRLLKMWVFKSNAYLVISNELTSVNICSKFCFFSWNAFDIALKDPLIWGMQMDIASGLSIQDVGRSSLSWLLLASNWMKIWREYSTCALLRLTETHSSVVWVCNALEKKKWSLCLTKLKNLKY